MADRPRADDWWIAADGKWYPPELHPGVSATSEPTGERSAGDPSAPEGAGIGPGPTQISRSLTYAVTIALMAVSSLFIVAAFFGFRVSTELRDGSGELVTGLSGTTSNEVAYGGWLALGIVAFAVTGILVIIWTWCASAVFDRRGATDRRWRRGWTIGAWIIPIANLVLPKLVFNELERISRTPWGGDDVGSDWAEAERSPLGDLWWGLWVAGVVVNQVSSVMTAGPDITDDQLATAVMFNAIGLALIAAAGIVFLFVVRRIAIDSVTSGSSGSVSLPGDLI